MARGCSLWGVASMHARRRVSPSSVEDYFWHRSLRPRPKILTPKSSPGSRRLTTPQAAIWARATLSARDFTSLAGVSARSAPSGATTIGELCSAAAPISPPPSTARQATVPDYQFRTQALIAKLFAGVEAEDQNITPRDPENSVQGSAVGLKLAAESCLDLSPLWFLSVDESYGTAFQEYWSLARLGHRLGPRFSLGIEGGALGNEE